MSAIASHSPLSISETVK